MVGVSASVNLPLHHKVEKFSSGIGSPGWSRKNGHKMVVVVVVAAVMELARLMVLVSEGIRTDAYSLRHVGKESECLLGSRKIHIRMQV